LTILVGNNLGNKMLNQLLKILWLCLVIFAEQDIQYLRWLICPLN